VDPLPPALVLTAGLGTRLSPLTNVRAKAAVPVAGRPLIVRILEWLAGQGVSDAVLNLHHRPETIAREVGHGEQFGLRVRYSWEPVILGSAGGPRQALPLLGSRFFIVNGDTVTDLSLRALSEHHAATEALVTLAVTPHPAPERYGGVQIDNAGWIRGFSRVGDASAMHFVGVQLAEANVFGSLPAETPATTIGGIYDNLTGANKNALCAFPIEAPFREVGTPHDYLETTLGIANDEGLPLSVISANSKIHRSATLTQTTVWDHVEIGANCCLHECIVTDNVILPTGTNANRQIFIATERLASTLEERRFGNALVYPIESGTPLSSKVSIRRTKTKHGE